MGGQFVYRNGELVATMEMRLPPDMPFGFAALPQYETERVLTERLADFGTAPERGIELVSFTQDGNGVTAELRRPSGPERVHARYLVGCDGAHSVVRKGLGLTFEGGAFDEEYMLGDVEVDWSLPPGYASAPPTRPTATVDDALVVHPAARQRPLPDVHAGARRSCRPTASGDVAHGFEEGRGARSSQHIQAVLDRLVPGAHDGAGLRWSSVFRISHRIVDAYGRGPGASSRATPRTSTRRRARRA